MKVLFTFGGIPHYLNAMLNRLQAKGVEITVLSPKKGNTTIGKRGENGRRRNLQASDHTGEKDVLRKKRFPRPSRNHCGRKTGYSGSRMALLPASILPARTEKGYEVRNAKLVIREIPFQTPPYGKIKEYFKANPMHDEGMRLLSKGTGFYLRQWITARIRKYCYAQAAGTLNYSTAAYDILPSYGVRKEQIHVTYNSTDTEALLKEKESVLASPSILPPCDRRLLHIGRLVKWKRVDLLIEAFRKVAADPIRKRNW